MPVGNGKNLVRCEYNNRAALVRQLESLDGIASQFIEAFGDVITSPIAANDRLVLVIANDLADRDLPGFGCHLINVLAKAD